MGNIWTNDVLMTIDALWHTCVIAGCIVTIAAVSVQCFLHDRLPCWLPRSFTVGESAIIAQATATFSLYAGRHYLIAVSVQIRCFTVNEDVVSFSAFHCWLCEYENPDYLRRLSFGVTWRTVPS